MNSICVDFSKDYIKQVVNLANERFGKGYINEKKLLDYITSDKLFGTLIINKKNNNLLGYAIFLEKTLNDVKTDLKLSPKDIDNITEGLNENLCYIKSIALKKEYEKIGLGSKIFVETINKAIDKSLKIGICPAWKRKNEVPLKNVLLKSGFKYYNTVPLLWIDDKEYECVECKGPCCCDGEIYYKKLI